MANTKNAKKRDDSKRRTPVSIYIDDDMKDRLRRMADRDSRSVSQQVKWILRNAIHAEAGVQA